ncbi:DUF7539 family protein [Haloarcula marina]|uniref:DUF7539 family protein n=1 Tax=Haloarcula marina TaxID=2961574 RepID=UPI0020B642D2|nr:hypothetical protein [Halomicroarcula marina]
MAASDRTQLRRVREQLDGWTYAARDSAYADLFEGASAVLTDEELALLDRIDADMVRRTGDGLWNADEYGIVTAGGADDGPAVVCIAHPEIPYDGYRGEESLDEPTREQLNDVLWDYAERVTRYLQTELDAFFDQMERG